MSAPAGQEVAAGLSPEQGLNFSRREGAQRERARDALADKLIERRLYALRGEDLPRLAANPIEQAAR